MSHEVLVIGGGPAGVSAALALSRAGLKVTLCEQGPRLGGALHRQPDDPAHAVPTPRAHKRRWQDMMTALEASNVEVLCRHVFAGLEGNGAVLLEDRTTGRLVTRRPKALVLALGAVERVTPLPGWHLPGVTTVGGLQVMMKSTGRAPEGKVLVAGSGPLLVALSAQLAALGNAPVAVLERSPRAVSLPVILNLLRAPAYLWEAANYLLTLIRSGSLPQRGAHVEAITPRDGRLSVTIKDRNGRKKDLLVDRVALHDGLLPNANGTAVTPAGPFVVRAGDCREILGGVAAIADGRRAAAAVLAHLDQSATPDDEADKALRRERHAQATLAPLFDYTGMPAAALPDDTIICRCEGKTLGQLRELVTPGDAVSAREIKLNGRFGMGACQGRFCAEWVAGFLSTQRDGQPAEIAEITGSRWPVKPVAIAAFTTLPTSESSK